MGGRRTPEERERDLTEAVRRCIAGESQEEIARALGVSPAQVSRDLRRQIEKWLSAARQDYARYQEGKFPGVVEIEAMCWRSWHESKRPRESKRVRIGGGVATYTTTTTVRTQPGEGNPAYLAMVIKCIATRNRFLGLKGVDLKSMPSEQREKREPVESLRNIDVVVLLGELKRRYGRVHVWLGLSFPEIPDRWRGCIRLYEKD